MRVLHVIPSVGPARGGPSIAVRLMAQACARTGAHVDIATSNDNDRALLQLPLGEMQREAGVGTIHFARDFYPYTVSRMLGSWVREHIADYDVVHIHALFSYASTVAARAARRRGVPFILRPLGTLAPYGLAQHRWLKVVSWRLFEKKMLEHAAAVHFTSAAEAAEAAALGMGARGVVIPLGIDVSASDARRDKAWLERHAPQLRERTIFLFLSRIHPKKRLELVLNALAETYDDNAGLIVAGAGDAAYVAQLQQLARKLQIDDAVCWAGQLAGDAKAAVLRAADAFVLPSINENFGIAVVEAMAAGLPVVVSTGVAIHREIARAHAGLLADTEPEVIGAMRHLGSAPERAALGSRARGLAEREFSLDAMGAGLMKLYEQVAA